MNIKNKIRDALSPHVSLWATSSEPAINACAKIAEEDAIGFAGWIHSEGYAEYGGMWSLDYGCGFPMRTMTELYSLYQQSKA